MDIIDFHRASRHSLGSLMRLIFAATLAAVTGCSEEVPTEPRPDEDEVLEAITGVCELNKSCRDPGYLEVPPEQYVDYCTDKKLDEVGPAPTPCLRAVLDYYQCLLDLDASDHMRGCHLFRYGMTPLECGDLDLDAARACGEAMVRFSL